MEMPYWMWKKLDKWRGRFDKIHVWLRWEILSRYYNLRNWLAEKLYEWGDKIRRDQK